MSENGEGLTKKKWNVNGARAEVRTVQYRHATTNRDESRALIVRWSFRKPKEHSADLTTDRYDTTGSKRLVRFSCSCFFLASSLLVDGTVLTIG